MGYEIFNLFKGEFIRRYNRFFVDFRLENKIFQAYCPNTGSMKSCLSENSEALFSYSLDPNRKLFYTLEFIKNPDWILVNTQRINSIFEFFLKDQKRFFYQYYIKEISFPNFRPDFLLFNENDLEFLKKFNLSLKNQNLLFNIPSSYSKPLLIEIKNVTYYLENEDCLIFPDAKTLRGTKHLKNFIYYLQKGFDCSVFFVLSRPEGNYFRSAEEIDPEFTKNLYDFYQKGGKIYTLRMEFKVNKKNWNSYSTIINFLEIKEIHL